MARSTPVVILAALAFAFGVSHRGAAQQRQPPAGQKPLDLNDMDVLEFFVRSEINAYENYDIAKVDKWLAENAQRYVDECETCQ